MLARMARILNTFADGSPFAAESDGGMWVDPQVRVASELKPGATGRSISVL